MGGWEEGRGRYATGWIGVLFFFFQMVWLSRVCGKEEVGGCLCSVPGNNVPRQVCESQTGIKREG